MEETQLIKLASSGNKSLNDKQLSIAFSLFSFALIAVVLKAYIQYHS
jgi:hypothetical protein